MSKSSPSEAQKSMGTLSSLIQLSSLFSDKLIIINYIINNGGYNFELGMNRKFKKKKQNIYKLIFNVTNILAF